MNMFDGYTSYSTLTDYVLNNTNNWVTSNPVTYAVPASSTTPTYETVYTTKTVWVPATVYVAGTPSIPATPTQITYSKKKGWGTWARSMEALEKGSFYEFTCYKANEGLFLGVGPEASLGDPISLFSHAIIADSSGIMVYENGVSIGTIKSNYSHLSKIKIFYLDDGSIAYVITTGTETLVYTSTELYDSSEAYVFGYIYSSDDRVLTSSINEGNVQYGSV